MDRAAGQPARSPSCQAHGAPFRRPLPADAADEYDFPEIQQHPALHADSKSTAAMFEPHHADRRHRIHSTISRPCVTNERLTAGMRVEFFQFSCNHEETSWIC
jgi:hypothetical protein